MYKIICQFKKILRVFQSFIRYITWNYFSRFVVCLISLVILRTQTPIHQLSSFTNFASVIPKKSLPNPKWQKLSIRFASRNFSFFTLRTVRNFELVFVYVISVWINLFCTQASNCQSTNCCKNYHLFI